MKQAHRELNTAIVKFIPFVFFVAIFLPTMAPLLSLLLTIILTGITFISSLLFWLIMKGTGIY